MKVWVVYYAIRDGGGGIAGVYATQDEAETKLDECEADPIDYLASYYAEEWEVNGGRMLDHGDGEH